MDPLGPKGSGVKEGVPTPGIPVPEGVGAGLSGVGVGGIDGAIEAVLDINGAVVLGVIEAELLPNIEPLPLSVVLGAGVGMPPELTGLETVIPPQPQPLATGVDQVAVAIPQQVLTGVQQVSQPQELVRQART